MVRGAVVLAALAVSLGFGSEAALAACKGTTQMELNECAGADFKRSDAAMNAAYAKLMKRIGPTAQDGLKAAQRAWLSYRDKSCDLEALAVEGGSIQPLVRAECLSQLTAERTKMLNGYLTCGDGDTNCVGRISE